MPNRLANCQSLYLRQHADNPVDWHPWDDEAWETARRLNRPVFLSVGYSTCHWCHVMAHECFEDDEVADALNRNFVSIKLDREERPDLDEAYMSAVQIASGRGGWPMTLFLTPDCEPFFAGTYFPKHSVQGHPGFLQIVNGLATAWAEERENVLESAKRFGSALRQVRQRSIPAESVSVALVDRAVQDLHEQFDHVNGGFGSEPKFPPYTVLSFLLDFARLRPGLADPDGTGEVLAQQATHMALETLAAMARGGIRDHIGGGFHRYSTDSEWHVPHFEKMLYDNALLLGVYGRVRDRHAMFGDVCDHLVKWLESEMVTSEGVLAAALDADSDGSEGSYYVWDHQEALALVGSETLARYGFKPGGNFNDEATGVPSRLNILHLSENEVRDPALDRLATARETRPKPAKDDKGLAAWNGLAISGLVKAGHVELAAERARPWANLLPDIPHIYAADSRQSGFLDDFCAMGIAFQDLAEATHDDIWADAAETVCNEVERRFGDGSGGFNFAQTGVSNPFGDGRQHMDNPTPAANGLVVRLLRNAGLADRSKTALAQVAGWAEHMSSGCATILSECLHHLVESGGDADLKAPGPPQITLEILPAELSVAEDGFAAATLVIHLPKGHHMPTFQPAASWLVPTQMEVEGAFAEAGFPDPDGDWYEDLVEVTMRIKPLSTGGSPVTVKVTAQLCSETTCFAPQTVSATATLST